MTEYQIFLCRFLVPLLAGCVAMHWDWRESKIPNRLTVPVAIAGLLFQLVTSGWSGLADGLLGFLIGFGLLLILFLLGGGGGGDVKWMAAIGAWLGPRHLLWVFVLSAFVLLFYLLGLLVVRGVMSITNKKTNPSAKALLSKTIPYAVPSTIALALRFAMVHLNQHY